MRDRFYDALLGLDIRIAVEYGGRPVDDYAVMLQVRDADEWRTVFLVDNAHGTHHAHRYSGGEKGQAEDFYEGPDAYAIRYAVDHITENAETLIEQWRDTL